MRKPRILKEGARYHVTARINRQEMIFEIDGMKDLFLRVLIQAKAKYKFRIENFNVMGNHVHIITQPHAGQNLSRIMQWILSVFAMRFNKIMGYTGHLWGERFFSRIISGLSDFIRTILYIDENPVRAFQVSDRKMWKYGGLYHSCHGIYDIIEKTEKWLLMLLPDRAPLMIS
jgi:putative transposase